MIKEKKVSLIENGTVIDHISSQAIFKIISFLELENKKTEILIGINLKSNKNNSKGILKLNCRYLTGEEKRKLSILAENSTVSEIENYEIKKKYKLYFPEKIESIVKCFNPNCITNNEPMKTCFKISNEKELKLECIYCERIMNRDNIVFN